MLTSRHYWTSQISVHIHWWILKVHRCSILLHLIIESLNLSADASKRYWSMLQAIAKRVETLSVSGCFVDTHHCIACSPPPPPSCQCWTTFVMTINQASINVERGWGGGWGLVQCITLFIGLLVWVIFRKQEKCWVSQPFCNCLYL